MQKNLLIADCINGIVLAIIGIYLLLLGFNRIKIKDSARAEKMKGKTRAAKLFGSIFIVLSSIMLYKVIEIALRP
jgi:hypothetical protein